ncbi:aldo/keto reductase [Kineosporia sp. A_224]|uniref:aldo/keto reductase n=1 Tax=Kineosporia sp. A_224 TaxID=1962180 RepID=UPI000B4C1C18|nr:aldo/keto reductase [Kineosporia sp. A_224]MBI4940435.1 aldo/keto reductase [Actinomycetota bacterium]
MEQRAVGRSGLLVSRLGLGTLTWGRDTDEHEAADQLREFADAGGTLVDTAASYGDGASETVLGSLLGTLVPREDVIVCTKAGVVRRHGVQEVDTSRRTMLAALDGSLRRLRTDHVDLWLAQAWHEDVPLEETMSALEHALRTGRARYVGFANYCGWQTARAATLLEAAGAGGLGGAGAVAAEVEFSLVQRGVEREVLPAAEALGLGVLAWSPLGRGVLTGKYRTGTPADSRAASPHLSGFVGVYLDGASRRVVDAVATAADGLGCSATEVALAWVRDTPGVASALVGARTASQLRASLASEAVELPPEIRLALAEVSAPQIGYPERF